jgi:hypothetical protein
MYRQAIAPLSLLYERTRPVQARRWTRWPGRVAQISACCGAMDVGMGAYFVLKKGMPGIENGIIEPIGHRQMGKQC